MTPEEVNESLDQLMQNITKMSGNLLVGVGNVATSMIKERIQTTGTNADGGKYRAYEAWYQKYKSDKGKNKGFTDFSFTNRMWNNIDVILDCSNDEVVVITAKDKGQKGITETIPIKAHTRKGKKIPASTKQVYKPSNYEKLEKNTKNFGEILNLSKKEIEIVAQEYDNGIKDIIQLTGL